jgi:hypothetical protein
MRTQAHRFLHKDFVLSCAPTPIEGGRFQAHVAITYLGGERTRSQRFIDLAEFDTEAEAVEHARQAGIEWVDRHLGRK